MRPMKYQTQHGTKHIPKFAVPVSHFGEKQQINRSILPSTHIHFGTNYVLEALGGCYYGWRFAKAKLGNVVCGVRTDVRNIVLRKTPRGWQKGFCNYAGWL